METKIALSLAHAAVCPHCSLPIHQSGVVGSWVLLPCSRRTCRNENDGAWNFSFRAGDMLMSVAVPQRLASALRVHLSKHGTAEELRRLIAAAGPLWHGPEVPQ